MKFYQLEGTVKTLTQGDVGFIDTIPAESADAAKTRFIETWTQPWQIDGEEFEFPEGQSKFTMTITSCVEGEDYIP